MASAHKYTWTRADGTRGRSWRAKWTGADGRARSRRGFDRQGDALAYARAREAAARTGTDQPGALPATGTLTLARWSQQWLTGLDVRPSTRASYEYAVARILPVFGARPLTGLRPSEIRAWQRGLEQRLARSTSGHTSAVLAMMLRAAVADDLIAASPMPAHRRRAKDSRVVDPSELLTVSQVQAWAAAMPPVGREMPTVAALTGLRQGELLGLRLPNVDFLRREIRVVEQLVTPVGAGRPEFGPPKTAAGVRAVPLSTAAAEAVSRHLTRFPPVEGEPIFRGARGQRWRRGTFGTAYRTAARTAGLPGWAHWHALRDVAASLLIHAGVDVRAIMSILGHTSAEETLRTYGRIWPTAQDGARKALDALWAAEVEIPAGPEQGHQR